MRRLPSSQRSGVVSQQLLWLRRLTLVKRVRKPRFENLSFLFLACFSKKFALKGNGSCQKLWTRRACGTCNIHQKFQKGRAQSRSNLASASHIVMISVGTNRIKIEAYEPRNEVSKIELYHSSQSDGFFVQIKDWLIYSCKVFNHRYSFIALRYSNGMFIKYIIQKWLEGPLTYPSSLLPS